MKTVFFMDENCLFLWMKNADFMDENCSGAGAAGGPGGGPGGAGTDRRNVGT